MPSKTHELDLGTFRPLTKDEIDQRIEELVAELASSSCGADEDGPAGDSCQPRWISAAELVRRMRPFIVLN